MQNIKNSLNIWKVLWLQLKTIRSSDIKESKTLHDDRISEFKQMPWKSIFKSIILAYEYEYKSNTYEHVTPYQCTHSVVLITTMHHYKVRHVKSFQICKVLNWMLQHMKSAVWLPCLQPLRIVLNMHAVRCH